MFETSDIEKLQSIIGCFEKPKFSISGQLKDNIDSLILSDMWPNEVAPSLVVRNDQQIAVRAKSIAHSYCLHNMRGKKFLDFGCGNGAVVLEACKIGLAAFGYDPIKQWPDDVVLSQDLTYETGNFTFSTDLDQILSNGPYDIIGLYDVVDHIMTHEEAVEALSFVRKCATSNTIIKVRCHPWTSRHGGHLYETINKAYAHILLSDEEYQKHAKVKVRKIKRPLVEYKSIFEEAGFLVSNIEKLSLPMEKMFGTDEFARLFTTRLTVDSDSLATDKTWQSQVLAFTFVDYVLRFR